MSTASSSSATNLEVFLRVRPRDQHNDYAARYKITDGNTTIKLDAPDVAFTRKFAFNHIFGEAASNEQVFDKIGKSVVDRFLGRYTNLLFTYGITGSGKTYTVGGLLPNIIRSIFEHELIRSKRYTLRASYVENYCKHVVDLCSEHDNAVRVRVIDSERVELNAECIALKDAAHALEILRSGSAKRTKALTKFNTDSSRSHALFLLNLFEGDTIVSRLCVVDLAGSENVAKAGFAVKGARFQESRDINASLSVLRRCLEAMKVKQGHVPWRESILTNILYPLYLRGKGYVTMIVTAHINDTEYNETVRALEFAANSQKIRINPVVNSVRMLQSVPCDRAARKNMMHAHQQELLTLKQSMMDQEQELHTVKSQQRMLSEQCQAQQQRIKDLNQMVKDLRPESEVACKQTDREQCSHESQVLQMATQLTEENTLKTQQMNAVQQQTLRSTRPQIEKSDEQRMNNGNAVQRMEQQNKNSSGRVQRVCHESLSADRSDIETMLARLRDSSRKTPFNYYLKLLSEKNKWELDDTEWTDVVVALSNALQGNVTRLNSLSHQQLMDIYSVKDDEQFSRDLEPAIEKERIFRIHSLSDSELTPQNILSLSILMKIGHNLAQREKEKKIKAKLHKYSKKWKKEKTKVLKKNQNKNLLFG